MSLSRPVRNKKECTDALVDALELLYPDLYVSIHILRLIAQFPPYRKLLSQETNATLRQRRPLSPLLMM